MDGGERGFVCELCSICSDWSSGTGIEGRLESFNPL
jgi:hypothetical protein